MEMTRKLRRVGNSVMLAIPSEVLAEAGLREGQSVTLRSQPGRLEVEATDMPDQRVAAFAARFSERYREALQELAR